jgi:hypothetical protein
VIIVDDGSDNGTYTNPVLVRTQMSKTSKKPDIDHIFEQIYEELATIKNSECMEQRVGHLAAAIVRNVNSES